MATKKDPKTKVETKKVEVKEKKDFNIKEFVKKYFKFIIIGAVLLVGIIVAIILLTNNKIKYPIIFVKDEKAYLAESNKKNLVEVDNKFSVTDNYDLPVFYANTTNKMFAYVNNKNLILYNTKTTAKEVVATNMSKYIYSWNVMFSRSDKYLIYKDDEGDIYSYDLITKNKVKMNAIDERSLTINDVYKDYLIYTTQGKDTNVNKKIVKDLKTGQPFVISDKIYSTFINTDKGIVFYVEKNNNAYTLYTYNLNNQKNKKIAENVHEYFYNEDYNAFIYTLNSKKSTSILEDDQLNKEPEVKIQSECTFSDYYYYNRCSQSDWIYGRTYTTTVSKKEINDTIREYANSLITYDVYYHKNNRKVKIAENVSDIITANVDKKTILYFENSIKPKQKVKISEFVNLDAFKAYVGKETKSLYYKQNKKAPVLLKEDFNLDIKGKINNKLEAYLIIEDKEKKESNLYYLSMKRKNKELEVLDSNAYNILTILKNGECIYSSNYDSKEYEYDLKAVKGKNITILGQKAYSSKTTTDEILFYSNCIDNICSFSKYDGKLKTYANDVYQALYINNSNIYLLKNYSSANKTYDLYRLHNNKASMVAPEVKTGFISKNYPK